jgi:predicted RNA-binding protein with PUA domain
MNVYFCTDCGQPADSPSCPKCGSHRVHIAGDLHLAMIGLDVYLNIYRDALGVYHLIIKKPSGQKEIRLHDIDLIVGTKPT